MATPSVTNLTHGPAQVLFDDVEAGHTQGGVEITVTPNNRARNVDQFGDGEVAYIHTGDEVRINCPLAEWNIASMSRIYAAGLLTGISGSTSGYVGIGRSAGFIYQTADMKVIPRLSSQAAQRAQFYRTCPIGEFSLMHNADDDRIFEVEYAALVDESKTDGELIGKIFRS